MDQFTQRGGTDGKRHGRHAPGGPSG
jgi:hypothetical protein